MIGNPCCEYVQQVITALGRTYNRRVKFVNLQGILSYPSDYGCAGMSFFPPPPGQKSLTLLCPFVSGHPNISGHAKMAAATLKQL